MHRLQRSWPIPIYDFLEVDLPIPIFSSLCIYKQKSMQISMKSYLYNKINDKKIKISPILD